MPKQKFQFGDLVEVASDLGNSMSHFPGKGETAIVMGSYRDKYGGDNTNSYTLFFLEYGEVSWYYASQLTLIQSGAFDILHEWKTVKNMKQKKESDLEWIFENAEYVLEKRPGASISALAKVLGITNLWGPHGEGFDYYLNMEIVLGVATPFLKNNDLEGFQQLWVDNRAAKMV